MDFKSPTVRFSIPFVLLIIIAVVFRDTPYIHFALIFGLLGLSLVMVFRQQIHWRWYSKTPPPLDPQMIDIIERKVPYYQNLSVDYKRFFLKRMSLFLMAKEFETISEGGTFPADVKGLIAAAAVQISFGKEEFLFPDFKQVAIHPSTFRSVENRDYHSSETFIDPDYKAHSCLVFAADRLIHAFDHPKAGYNIALHEMANAYKFKFDLHSAEIPLFNNPAFYQNLAIIRGFTVEQAKEYTKNKTLSPFGLAIEHLFYNPEKFKELMPELYETFCNLLNQDPVNREDPVIFNVDYDLLVEQRDIY
jgi:Mlc titration factor MtfA (ptsG expression regulator)